MGPRPDDQAARRRELVEICTTASTYRSFQPPIRNVGTSMSAASTRRGSQNTSSPTCCCHSTHGQGFRACDRGARSRPGATVRQHLAASAGRGPWRSCGPPSCTDRGRKDCPREPWSHGHNRSSRKRQRRPGGAGGAAPRGGDRHHGPVRDPPHPDCSVAPLLSCPHPLDNRRPVGALDAPEVERGSGRTRRRGDARGMSTKTVAYPASARRRRGASYMLPITSSLWYGYRLTSAGCRVAPPAGYITSPASRIALALDWDGQLCYLCGADRRQ